MQMSLLGLWLFSQTFENVLVNKEKKVLLYPHEIKLKSAEAFALKKFFIYMQKPNFGTSLSTTSRTEK